MIEILVLIVDTDFVKRYFLLKGFTVEAKCRIFILLESFLKRWLYNSRDIGCGARKDDVDANSVYRQQDMLFLDNDFLFRLLISLNEEALLTRICNCLE